jgi:hypothetical protein
MDGNYEKLQRDFAGIDALRDQFLSAGYEPDDAEILACSLYGFQEEEGAHPDEKICGMTRSMLESALNGTATPELRSQIAQALYEEHECCHAEGVWGQRRLREEEMRLRETF